jgi:hypothetical protein
MSRIILHIGTHKTATTHIQDLLFHNRKLLARHGIIYPRIGVMRAHHGLASGWIKLPERYRLRNPQGAWTRIVKTWAATDKTIFISSEELSRLYPARVNMAQLRDIVSGFDDITVLCCLRNQAGFLQSVYQQISDERNPGRWPQFLNQALERRVVDGLSLDYNLLYDHLRTGFAPGEIQLVSYDLARSSAGGIVQNLIETLDLPVQSAELVPCGPDRANVSPPPLASLVANMIAAPGVAPPALVTRVLRQIEQSVPEAGSATLFSRAELAQLRRTVRPWNRRLHARVPDGFEFGPMPGPGPRIFRGRLETQFWMDLCRDLALAPG